MSSTNANFHELSWFYAMSPMIVKNIYEGVDKFLNSPVVQKTVTPTTKEGKLFTIHQLDAMNEANVKFTTTGEAYTYDTLKTEAKYGKIGAIIAGIEVKDEEVGTLDAEEEFKQKVPMVIQKYIIKKIEETIYNKLLAEKDAPGQAIIETYAAKNLDWKMVSEILAAKEVVDPTLYNFFIHPLQVDYVKSAVDSNGRPIFEGVQGGTQDARQIGNIAGVKVWIHPGVKSVTELGVESFVNMLLPDACLDLRLATDNIQFSASRDEDKRSTKFRGIFLIGCETMVNNGIVFFRTKKGK